MGRSRDNFIKYPRTPHIYGSKLTTDDKQLSKKSSIKLFKKESFVVEEKLDGSNTAISFNSKGELILQCRGHILTSGDHPHFDLFKRWAYSNIGLFSGILQDSLLMYGEWLYARHTIYYNDLPHYFFEFDIYEKKKKKFLDTKSRHNLLNGTGIISVPVLYQGEIKSIKHLTSLISKSVYGNELAEGLYLKTEADGYVTGRYKYVRQSFIQKVKESKGHWKDRPIEVQKLSPGVKII